MRKAIHNLLAYITQLMKTYRLFFSSSRSVAIVLAILLPIQALLPIATVQTGQAIIDAISIKHPFMSLFTLWLIATLLTQLLPALATLVQGILTDKLTGFINLSLMEKSKALISLAIFDDSEYFDDLCKGPR